MGLVYFVHRLCIQHTFILLSFHRHSFQFCIHPIVEMWSFNRARISLYSARPTQSCLTMATNTIAEFSSHIHTYTPQSTETRKLHNPTLNQVLHGAAATFSTSRLFMDLQSLTKPVPNPVAPEKKGQPKDEDDTRHAVVSTFDLFSIGIGPSSR